MRREKNTDERYFHLIPQGQRIIPYLEIIDRLGRQIQIQIGFGRCRVITDTCAVDESAHGVHRSTCKQL